MIDLRCSKCQQKLKAKPELAGKVVRCPTCGEPIAVPNAATEKKPADEAITSQPTPPPAAEADDELFDVEFEVEEGKKKKRRRRRRKREEESFLTGVYDNLYYVFGGVGIFPVVAAVLVLFWCCLGCGSLVFPPFALCLIGLGPLCYLSGYFWLLFIAFRDDAFHGMMCFFTHFYWIVYVFVNTEEAWKPATLMALGFLMSVSGGIVIAILVRAAEGGP